MNYFGTPKAQAKVFIENFKIERNSLRNTINPTLETKMTSYKDKDLEFIDASTD